MEMNCKSKKDTKLVYETTDKTRESIFNIIISYLKINEINNKLPLQGFNVLDIFAGTGALGFEAISRGAEKVTFIEKSRDNLRVLYKNIDHQNRNQHQVLLYLLNRSLIKVS